MLSQLLIVPLLLLSIRLKHRDMNIKKGFTLIELLVVIAIIAILSTVAVTVFRGITANARDSVRIKDLQAIKQALELYRNDFHYYPTTDLTNIAFIRQNPLDKNCTGIPGCTTYLRHIPRDSDSNRKYYYLALPSSPVCDNKSLATTCTGFILCAKKEGTNTSYEIQACKDLPAGSCGVGIICDIGISSQ